MFAKPRHCLKRFCSTSSSYGIRFRCDVASSPRKSKPSNFWSSKENRKAFLMDATKKLMTQARLKRQQGANDALDQDFERKEVDLSVWYHSNVQTLSEMGGLGLLNRTKGSMIQLLKETFPDHNWEVWKFQQTNRGFWKNDQNRADFFKSIEKELKIESVEDWYSIKTSEVDRLGGRFLLHQTYGGSLVEMLKDFYPNHQWLAWKFHKTPQRFWIENDGRNQREYMEWLRKQLNITSMEELYSLKPSQIRANHGAALLAMHRTSLYLLLKNVYPEHKWLPWKFSLRSIWNDPKVRREFLDWVASQLNFPASNGSKDPSEEWYQLTKSDITRLGGSALLAKHGPLAKLLASTYPEWTWQNWKFDQSPKLEFHPQLLSDSTRMEQFVAYVSGIGKSLGVESLDDWYRVSVKMLSKTALIATLRQWDSLSTMLKVAYPNHVWDTSKFGLMGKKSRQNQIALELRRLFPQLVFEEDVKLRDDEGLLELDLFCRSANLAFEVDGEHHFYDVTGVNQTKGFQQRDNRKHALCIRRGLTLVSVPFDVDFDAKFISNYLQNSRPDLATLVSL